MKLINKLRDIIIHQSHVIQRKKYLNKNFPHSIKRISILSNNCIGGFVYENFKIPYQSPTMYINTLPLDFIRFVNNCRHLSSEKLVQSGPHQEQFTLLGGEIVDFPCGFIGDIPILFQHEKEFEVAKEKWDRRFGRLDYNRIVVIMFVNKNLITNEFLEAYKTIPYPKILLSNSPTVVGIEDCAYIEIDEGKDWWQTKNGIIRFFEQYNFSEFWAKVPFLKDDIK